MQGRHRRILIRQRRTRSLIECPRSTELGDRVDESEVLRTVVVAQFMFDARTALAEVRARLVEQARWHEWKEDETDECESGHCRERVAPLAEHVGALLEQHEEDGERDEEVSSSVVRVHQFDEPRVWKEPILDRLFVVETECPLDSNHAHRIGERMQWNLDTAHERRTELIANQCVDGIEGANDEHLLPPQCAVVAGDGDDRGGSGRVVHVIHRIGEPALD